MCVGDAIPSFYKCQINISSKIVDHKVLGSKSDVSLEISSESNASSVRIYMGTTVGYPTQFSSQGKL